ncbi:MAG TPA: DUF4097 family beta strand repeat-containing protein [Acidimicrobiales bacterium]|nr:DUF4097 family beta strand repeat-containing protein [Acidimicrobiales bacterium]
MKRTVGSDEGRLTIDLDEVDSVEVQLVGGEIMVAGSAGPGRLEVEWLAGPPVDVSLEGGRLAVRQVSELWGLRRGPRAAVAVTCPPGTAVRTRSVSAPTVVAGIAAAVTTTTVSGSVTWGYVSGELTAHTVSGRVDMEGVGGALRVDSVSGPIGVAGGHLRDLSVLSTSGDVAVDLESQRGGRYRCRTVSGDVAIVLSPEADLTVDAATISGRVDLPADRSRRQRGCRRAVLGSGDGSLRVDSVSGRLAVLLREPVPTP